MVVGVRVRDSEADGNFTQEWDRSIRSPDRREIVAQAEDELVYSGAQSVPGQEGTIGSAFGIGAHDVQPLSCIGLRVDPVELDGHSCRWAAMNCVEHVRGEASSHRQRLLIGLAVGAYAPRRIARVSRPKAVKGSL
jgi:hypothetical protein